MEVPDNRCATYPSGKNYEANDESASVTGCSHPDSKVRNHAHVRCRHVSNTALTPPALLSQLGAGFILTTLYCTNSVPSSFPLLSHQCQAEETLKNICFVNHAKSRENTLEIIPYPCLLPSRISPVMFPDVLGTVGNLVKPT